MAVINAKSQDEMFQPFGTKVTAVCQLPHAKAITGGTDFVLRESRQSYKMSPKQGPSPGGLNPVAKGRFAISINVICVGIRSSLPKRRYRVVVIDHVGDFLRHRGKAGCRLFRGS
jgi:hypothetical protein